MKRYDEFIFEDYSLTEAGFSFRFSMGEHIFTPCWTFDKIRPPAYGEASSLRNILDYSVFNLGMTEMISYWKAACPPVVRVRCGYLDDVQADWWKRLFKNGLGEFFYRNNITPSDNFIEIIPDVKKTPHFSADLPLSGALIPVGGGKDSVVTMELLRERVDENLAYMINGRAAAVQTAVAGGFTEKNTLCVTRSVDRHLLELNARGYLNGHTPFSAIVAFSSFIFALLRGKRHIILSNESSANEGNTGGVNHQYSKSVDFEEQFRNYVNYCFGGGVPEYFSLLRSWSEWRITREFVKYPRYFPIFQSCNAGTKTNSWCKKCPKCLYVCVMLSAFLDDETLEAIFGGNLLNNADFAETLDALVFPEKVKPFECVGTYAEVRHAVLTACENRSSRGIGLPLLYRNILGRISGNTGDTAFRDCNTENEKNFIPCEYKKYLL